MNKTLSSLLALLLAASPAAAIEWQAMGPRALGMGGAGVTLTQGPLASYWNPAALGRATENSYGLAVPFGVHAALTGTVVEGAKDLQNLKDSNTTSDADVQAALNKLNDPNNGLRINALGGANLKVGKVAVFANGFVDMGAIPVVDTVHASAAQLTSNQNTSKLIVKGARLVEAGVGYGHELPFAPGVFLGGNLKVLQAQVGYADYQIFTNNNNDSDILKTLKNGAKTSSNFGVDLGALWDVNRTFENAWWQPRVGLVGRNLNNPKFKLPATAVAAGYTGKYSVNPQLRMGASVSPFNWWHLATDLDLTRNLTPVDGVASRQFGLGTEIDVFNRSWINIPLRFGLARNLANTGAGTMLTAGTGLNFLHLMLDVSGEYSPQTIQTQSQGKSEKIPKEFGVSVQLSLLFGGSDDRADRMKNPAPAAPAEKAAPAPTPEQVKEVKKDAEKAQQDLNKEATTPH